MLFCSGVAVPIGKLQSLTLDGFKRAAMSFCMAGVALRDIWTCLIVFDKVSKVTLCDRPASERSFLDDFHSLWQAQHCEDVHVTFLWQARHLRRAVSHVFVESHWQWLTKCKCRGRRGTWCAPFFRGRRNVW